MIPDETCTSCPTVLRYDDLYFLCDSCTSPVCPKCAGMDANDCDDPMPKVECCHHCALENQLAAMEISEPAGDYGRER